MERSSEAIQLDLKTTAEMLHYHEARVSHYQKQMRTYTMELNRARRLEHEVKELQT